MSNAPAAGTPADTPESPNAINPWLSLALLAVVQLMIVLDVSITNVALPEIGVALNMDEQALSWVVNAYALIFGGLLLLGGRMGDLLGRRRLFAVGLAIFGAASLMGGLSTEDWMIVLARGLQGIGAAVIAPAVLSITATLFAEGAERNKALGVIGAIAGSGGAIGVLLGGVLTDKVGWEWVFFVNVPLALGALVATFFVLPESREAGLTRHFDLPGAILVTTGMIALVYALVDANDAGWTSTQTVGLLLTSAVLLGMFYVVEQRSPQPLMRFGILRIPTVAGANSVGVAIAASMFAMFFFLTFFMQNVLGLSPLETGLRYLPLALSIIVSAGVASGLTTRLGVRRVMITGLTITGAGMVWLTQIDANGSWLSDLLGPMMMAGFGMGFVFVPMMIAAVAGVRDSEHGLASGLINTTQQVGGAAGFAVLFTIFSSARDDTLASATPGPEAAALALTDGTTVAFYGCAAFAVLALILALFLVRPNPADEQAALATMQGGAAE